MTPNSASAPWIAVVGSLNIDLIAYVQRVPNAGETLIGDDFRMGFGGKGANQAVMAARLGARVSMVGALGDDVYADMTFANLDRQGVILSHVGRVEGSSGVAPIWVEAGGQNRIIVVPGANDRVDPDAAARDPVARGCQVVIGQLEIPQAVTVAAFRAARRGGHHDDPQPRCRRPCRSTPSCARRRRLPHPERARARDVAGGASIDLDDEPPWSRPARVAREPASW